MKLSRKLQIGAAAALLGFTLGACSPTQETPSPTPARESPSSPPTTQPAEPASTNPPTTMPTPPAESTPTSPPPATAEPAPTGTE